MKRRHLEPTAHLLKKIPGPQDRIRTSTSSMNPSSGMDSKDSYGSGPRSGNEPGTYRDSKFNGQSPSTFVLASFSALVYGLYADWKYRHPQRS